MPKPWMDFCLAVTVTAELLTRAQASEKQSRLSEDSNATDS